MAVDPSIIVEHEGYEHSLGMPCRECRLNEARGIEPKTKKATKTKKAD